MKGGKLTMHKFGTLNKDYLRTLYFAGGCFWGVEHYFSQLPGVNSTRVAYVNGKSNSTSYALLKETDHAEAVEVKYEANVIRLQELLLHFFRMIDPCSLNRQGNDTGRQYRTGIYYLPERESEDLPIIKHVYHTLEKQQGKKFVVEVEPLRNVQFAEENHQKYLEKNPHGYCHLPRSLAKEPLFPRNFPKPSDEELRSKLSLMAYAITQEAATEKPFTSIYEQEYARGLYVNIVTGEPLFSSEDKFDAGCGWPSFSRPLLASNLHYEADFLRGYERTEVKTKEDDAHLGHVFPDGPLEAGGLRYCINGAALRFIPFEKMDEEGYSEYKVLFDPEPKSSQL